LLVRRLAQLENLGLAVSVSDSTWVLTDGWQARLRSLGERGDILKQIHRAIDGGDPTRFYAVGRGQGLPDGQGCVETRPLVGRVARKGLADEQKGTFYAVLETPTGDAYHVPIGARTVDKLRVGELVSFQTERERAVERETPTRYRLSIESMPLSLDAQVGHRGPVWLDTLDPKSVARTGFGAEVRRAIERRRQTVVEVDSAPVAGQRDVRLQDVERRAIGRNIALRTGQEFLDCIPSGFRGRVEPAPDGGPYLSVSNGRTFVIVPVTAQTRALRTKTVEVLRDSQGRFLGIRARDIERGR
jgi:hypothetical protein